MNIEHMIELKDRKRILGMAVDALAAPIAETYCDHHQRYLKGVQDGLYALWEEASDALARAERQAPRHS